MGHVYILIPPEAQGLTLVTTPASTFDLRYNCRWWYKRGNKTHHNTDIHCSKTNISQYQVGYKHDNLAIGPSGQNNSVTTTFGHPNVPHILHNNLWFP